MPLLKTILANSFSRPETPAVIDDRGTVTYRQLAGASMFVANQIEKISDKKNVGILLPTSAAVPIAVLGAWLSSRVPVIFNFLLNKEELAAIVADSQVDTIITSEIMLHFIGADKIPPHIKVIKLEQIDMTEFPPLRWPPHLDDDETAVILYTSGTSGQPKGVMLTHGNLESDTLGAIEHAGITSADTFLGVLPQFHSFGLTALTLLPLTIGATVVYTAKFVPRRIVELIKKHRPQVIMAVPSMYGVLLTVKDACAEDFTSIRLAISGGEALPKALAMQFEERFHVKILEGYGLTETSPITHWSTPTKRKLGAVGTQLPGVITIIVDENERPVGPDTDGEILLAGPIIMKGYFRKPDATSAVITAITLPGVNDSAPIRAFRTGDIGRLDSEGFLYITGRKKEIFKVAGEMVSPREIEECLNKHPSVNAAAVIPKSDGIRGLVPVAFIELKPEQMFDENALRTWCRDSLANYKVPRDIRKIDSLPRNATGKILRRQLSAD